MQRNKDALDWIILFSFRNTHQLFCQMFMLTHFLLNSLHNYFRVCAHGVWMRGVYASMHPHTCMWRPDEVAECLHLLLSTLLLEIGSLTDPEACHSSFALAQWAPGMGLSLHPDAGIVRKRAHTWLSQGLLANFSSSFPLVQQAVLPPEQILRPLNLFSVHYSSILYNLEFLATGFSSRKGQMCCQQTQWRTFPCQGNINDY